MFSLKANLSYFLCCWLFALLFLLLLLLRKRAVGVTRHSTLNSRNKGKLTTTAILCTHSNHPNACFALEKKRRVLSRNRRGAFMQSKAHQWIRYETKRNVVIEIMERTEHLQNTQKLYRASRHRTQLKKQQTKQKNKSKLFAIFCFAAFDDVGILMAGISAVVKTQ